MELSRIFTYNSFNYEGVFKVTNVAAIFCLTSVDTSSCSPTFQAVGFFSTAQVVDKGAQWLQIIHLLCDDHLLLDYIGLWQVSSFLHMDQ